MSFAEAVDRDEGPRPVLRLDSPTVFHGWVCLRKQMVLDTATEAREPWLKDSFQWSESKGGFWTAAICRQTDRLSFDPFRIVKVPCSPAAFSWRTRASTVRQSQRVRSRISWGQSGEAEIARSYNVHNCPSQCWLHAIAGDRGICGWRIATTSGIGRAAWFWRGLAGLTPASMELTTRSNVRLEVSADQIV